MPIQVTAVGADAYTKSLTAGMLQLNQAAASVQAAGHSATAAQSASGGFQQLLGQAIDQTVRLQSAAEGETKKFLTGEVDDLHKVMIAEEKAGLAFQLTMQVRNKMVEAYQEIIRMQI